MERLLKFLAVVLLAALAACPAARAQERRELIVSAAASLTNAFTEVAAAYEKENPQVRVVLNFAASGSLFRQLENGAPVDVFATADQETMNRAEAGNLIAAETRRNFVRNVLVLAVPAGGRLQLASVRELGRAEVKRIAFGDPDTTPGGRYAKKWLVYLGLWDAVESKMIPGNGVRQVLEYISRGEVDAGFVFSTDAAVAGDKVAVVEQAKELDPILYPIALVTAGSRKALAAGFEDFVTGPKGMAILERFGFGRP